ncbi:alkaline-phosphatase-like protein [Kalaharituber pfeilii]|nr:alkaline-phosphatase-like protein [Kalaharituber pfeilii]
MTSSFRSSDEVYNAERNDAEQPLLNTPADKEHARVTKWRQLALLVWAAVASVGVIILGVLYYQAERDLSGGSSGSKFPPSGKRNVVFMVSDGMGPTSLHVTRSWRQYTEELPYYDTLFLDKHIIGTSRTRSSDSLITDSAAGATAFSCGKKSYNGAISVLPDHSPCGTILEAAKKAGYMTGLVVTTRITDATPACFSAHVNMRSEEDRIAEQQIGDYPLGRMVDLMLGGGRCHFLPNSTADNESCRADNRDVIGEAQSKYGFSYVHDRAGFDYLQKGKNVTLPLIGLFAKTDIPYEIDRKDKDYPALWEMAEAAITALSEATKNSDRGFFLMVEGSRIDHAGHANDPAAQVREVLAYDKTFRKVVEWVENSDVQGVVVSTSDHETGGLAAARQLQAAYPDYLWYPGVLANASHSSEYLAVQLAAFPDDDDKKLDKYIRHTVLEEGLGIYDASDEEFERLKKAKTGAIYTLTDMVSRRAQIGWTTHGHSGVDVNIYGIGPALRKLSGNHENTEVGEFLRDYLQLDLDAVTKELTEKGVGRHKAAAGDNGLEWMGRSLAEITENEKYVTDQLDCYHGDFRKRSLGVVHECTGRHVHHDHRE